jgi:hypothetical protein
MRIYYYFLLIAFATITINASAQTRDEKINRARRELSARAETYLTEFNDMRLNFVDPRVQSFMSEKMGMTLSGDPSSNVDGKHITITETYQKKISSKVNDKALVIHYEGEADGNEIIIKECHISGVDMYVIDFFVKYWNTTLNFEDVKGKEVVTNYWITDRASLSKGNKPGEFVIVIARNN